MRSTPRRKTFREVAKALEAKFGEARKAALTWKPHNTVPVGRRKPAKKLLKLIDLLNEHDDVQNVFANFEVSDALVAKDGRVRLRALPGPIGSLSDPIGPGSAR